MLYRESRRRLTDAWLVHCDNVPHGTTRGYRQVFFLPFLALTIIPWLSNISIHSPRVPLGFVCGYPLQGGELYGGSMFARSAAADTRQGQAMQRVNEKWGSDALDRAGRESIGWAVCKKKYTPFVFPMSQNKDGTVTVTAERRLGCRAHHALRQATIAKHGLRPGWEPLGQWSRRKAEELARKETHRRNSEEALTTEDDLSLSSEEEPAAAPAVCSLSPTLAQNNFRSLCWNGNCLVKHPSRYDDVAEECRRLQACQAVSDTSKLDVKRKAVVDKAKPGKRCKA